MKTEYRACVIHWRTHCRKPCVVRLPGPDLRHRQDIATAHSLTISAISHRSALPRKGESIEYKPRPAIVKPPETAGLPAPQQNIAENNPAWVESPEETRARLLAEADANSGNSAFRSPAGKA
jgi:hypothetical protein